MYSVGRFQIRDVARLKRTQMQCSFVQQRCAGRQTSLVKVGASIYSWINTSFGRTLGFNQNRQYVINLSIPNQWIKIDAKIVCTSIDCWRGSGARRDPHLIPLYKVKCERIRTEIPGNVHVLRARLTATCVPSSLETPPPPPLVMAASWSPFPSWKLRRRFGGARGRN
jgi:hypothetical protein